MAQFVSTTIDIAGKSIKQFTSLAISQDIYEHHEFRLVCNAEALDGKSGNILLSSKNLVGDTINIQVSTVGGSDTFRFTGVITQVEVARHGGHVGDVIIMGFSPTVLLDNSPHCKTWEKKAVKNIVQDILSHFPQNLLQPKISPQYGETLSYTVQYKETAWQFLTRLSALYGEWLYYDGQKLVMGTPKGKQAKLIFGNNLLQFNMAAQLVPATLKMVAYDYMNHEVYDTAPSDISGKAGLNDLGKKILQKSEQFYATKPKQWHNSFLTNKKQLDDYVNTRTAMQAGNMVRFNGNSGHPGIEVGGTVTVESKNVINSANESMGEYVVISVNHYCDGQGNYSNDFVSVPSTIKMPPVTIHTEPHCETQSALVTDNNDPNGLGRIRVRFHWMADSQKSPWLRMTSMHGGDGKGMFFIPEIDEEVIVGFEGDSPTKPYVIGTVYHSKAKTDFSNKENDIKAIQTRSGNKIIMNDKEGSVFVEDKDGNSMKIDGEGNVNVLGNKTIVLTCGDSKIEMKKDGTINITGKKVTVNAQEKAKVVSNQASFTADGNSGDAKMEGMNAEISGQIGAKLKGGATTDVSASGQVAVKGAMIMLN